MTNNAPRRGRPPKISSEEIADAALKVGLDKATIRTVASELGVSVMGVYHHVSNGEELLDLAIAREVQTLAALDEGHATFEQALLDAAQRYYDLLTRFPEMQLRLISGRINPRGTAEYYQVLLATGMRHGLDAAEVFHAVRCVMMATAGAAVMNAGASNADVVAVLAKGVGQLEPDAAPNVRTLLINRNQTIADPLDTVRLVLAGLRQKLGPRMTDPIAPDC